MRNIVIIVLCLVNKATSSDECDGMTFHDAVQYCDAQGLELLTLSTYRQYLEVQKIFRNSSKSISWLALERNETIGNYQWLNGRILTELKWKSGEPADQTGIDCGVMEVSSGQWYSLSCSSNRNYICVGSDGNYSVGNTSVEFYTAVLNCQSENRRLPVAITNLDTNWLNDVINSLSGDIWLGLIRFGTDYFKWVTGEHLTPPYKWMTKVLYPRVHYHPIDEEFHSSSRSTSEVTCMSKSMDVDRSPNTFVLVSNNALVMGTSRKSTVIKSLSGFQCALECLQDTGCIQLTIDGYLCKTFGEDLFITNYSQGQKLWQRKVISLNL